ncbi:MAG: DNA primase [Chloroflexi bacterium]|nr:DNA primase [Chloroflexota bacterium]
MSVITEVKQRLDIVELVSEYVTLQKAGRNFKGLCPFHTEKHPSFFVFPEQQSWHCFGACGTGGDIFSFIMKKEGIDFGQALRLLAQRGGIALSPREAPSKAEDEKKEKLFQINEAVTEYYHHLLLSTKAGEAARSYLARRKVLSETIKEFRLGFSPDAWETIKNYLLGKGYTQKDLVEAGLIIEKEEGGSYDRFRNRLMFPICDSQGRVTGFGARVLDDSLPKYINSPQTPIFDKSSSLYGIDKAKSDIRKKNFVIIVEGYMDVLTAHQHGWQNVVGSMGTSLTEKQVEVIRKLTNNITLALDADLAGEEATLRGKAILAYSNAEANVILLPSGKDPDEVIREDSTLWQKLVEQAMPILDFAFQSVISKVDINKAKDKSLAVQKLLLSICEIKDPVQQSHYLKRLARELRIEESAIKAALRESKAGRKRPQPSKPTEQSRLARQFVSNPIEEYCLALLLQYPELRPLAQELSLEHFETTENREVFVTWQHSSDISDLESELDTSLLEHLYYLVNKDFLPAIRESEQTRRLDLANCVLRLQEELFRKLEREKEAMLEIEREKGGVSSELSKLEEQGISSGQQLQDVFVKKGKNHGFNERRRHQPG